MRKYAVEPVTYGGFFDVEAKQKEVAALEEKMAAVGFWDDQASAKKVIDAANHLKNTINPILAYQSRLDDLQALVELVEESENDATEYLAEIESTTQALFEELDSLEIGSFLSGPHDACNAIMSIHAGAGGTESCDWAEMLLRLYLRWAERQAVQRPITWCRDLAAL